MRIGVLGTGMVGRAISRRLEALGLDVRVGSRTAGDGAEILAGKRRVRLAVRADRRPRRHHRFNIAVVSA